VVQRNLASCPADDDGSASNFQLHADRLDATELMVGQLHTDGTASSAIFSAARRRRLRRRPTPRQRAGVVSCRRRVRSTVHGKSSNSGKFTVGALLIFISKCERRTRSGPVKRPRQGNAKFTRPAMTFLQI
jgi:hypothetical protein